MYKKAMMEAGATNEDMCLFVDDSLGTIDLPATDLGNVIGAKKFGWKKLCHYVEDSSVSPVEGVRQIHHLDELRDVYPHLFLQTNGN